MNSLATTRGSLAGAVAGVAGLVGYVYPPTVFKPGDGWAQWGGDLQVDGGPYAMTFTRKWRVIIILPEDMRVADQFVDGIYDQLIDAVSNVLAIETIEPSKLNADGSQAAYQALIITGETE
jgi:hypothetical protein